MIPIRQCKKVKLGGINEESLKQAIEPAHNLCKMFTSLIAWNKIYHSTVFSPVPSSSNFHLISTGGQSY